ncbi:hypothetical protein HYDPIDRAFT_100911 [Hydnomerulius pinastri MD-312]|uniref:Digeranylgeranylglyceryl phosphate synthase n=1 Tax=Hydnomerulius pinastri MD-312 TaxID=994086 RepID=A0A0C9W0D9_9AGAM|nr:hypothetical protein HYDPIDRAFT_100911 [Hydnomerulius pinastri MD-312]
MSVQRAWLSVRALFYHAHTLALFTKADVTTVLIPVTFFAVAAGPLCHPSRLLHAFSWIWLHTLQAVMANQIKAPEEDKINKPSRPLPQGRITVQNATVVRWLVAPVCLAFSAMYSSQLLATSFAVQAVTIWYNELNGDMGWLSKNILTAFLYGFVELGGTLAAGCDWSKLSATGRLAVHLNVAVFATTLHAQDFKDVSGDRLTGRRTFPMMFPLASRMVVGLGIPLWSFILIKIWDLDVLSSALFTIYSCYVGARFMFYRSVEADKKSCKYYSVSIGTFLVISYAKVYVTALVRHASPIPGVLDVLPRRSQPCSRSFA